MAAPAPKGEPRRSRLCPSIWPSAVLRFRPPGPPRGHAGAGLEPAVIVAWWPKSRDTPVTGGTWTMFCRCVGLAVPNYRRRKTGLMLSCKLKLPGVESQFLPTFISFLSVWSQREQPGPSCGRTAPSDVPRLAPFRSGRPGHPLGPHGEKLELTLGTQFILLIRIQNWPEFRSPPLHL